MMQVSEDAVVRLKMIDGNMVGDAEVRDFLRQYSYVESIDDPNRFELMSDKDEDRGAALVFADEFETVEFHGADSQENFMNANYILAKIGWATCQADSVDPGVRDVLAARLTHVDVLNLDELASIEGGAGDPLSGVRHADDAYADPQLSQEDVAVLQGMHENHQQIQHLTVELTDTKRQLDEALANLRKANQTIAQLQANQEYPALQVQAPRPEARERDGHVDAAPLVAIVERFLSSTLVAASEDDAKLLDELRRGGYTTQVRLVKI